MEKTWDIPLFDLDYGPRERAAVLDVLARRWLSMGPKTQEFEQAFSTYLGGKVRSCAVANGTAALHMALLGAGIGPGDEVLISGLSFVASLNAASLVGAKPVPVDCESLDDWNVSLRDAAAKVTRRTKAIVVVHYAGHPCDMTGLRAICRRRGILLVEDAAHAVGAEFRGRKCGTLGDIACFSFFSNKNLSTGEGGMLVTPDPELDRRFRLLRSHGMTSMTIDRHYRRAVSYDVLQPGLNYRMDEIRSALGLVQLAKLDRNNRRRAALTAVYHRLLARIPGLIVPWSRRQTSGRSSCHIMPVLLPAAADRIGVMERLRTAGIQTSIHYPSYRSFSAYRGLKPRLPVAEQISERVLTLPLYPGMSFGQVRAVCERLAESLRA